MTSYKRGEIVDITIKGVRIGDVDGHGCVSIIAVDCFDREHASWRMPPQAAVTRVAPAEWPPRPGDLWRDRRGNVWFAADLHDIEETDIPAVFMLASHEDHQVAPDRCNENYGPLTLVHREDEQDAASNDKPSLYADLVGERVGVQRTDGEYLTGVLTVADTYAVTIKVDRPVNGVPNRDVRAEDIATVRLLPAKDGGDRG